MKKTNSELNKKRVELLKNHLNIWLNCDNSYTDAKLAENILTELKIDKKTQYKLDVLIGEIL